MEDLDDILKTPRQLAVEIDAYLRTMPGLRGHSLVDAQMAILFVAAAVAKAGKMPKGVALQAFEYAWAETEAER